MSRSVIRSRDNATVKRAAKLLDSARERASLGLVPLEGCHLIRACLEAPAFGATAIPQVLVSEAAVDHPEVRATLAAVGHERVTAVAREVFARLGEEEGSNAVIGLVERRGAVEQAGQGGLRVCLDGVQDPGNVGTLIRTAAAAGATTVVLGRGCADPWSPKALRAGMGGQFRLVLHDVPDLADWLAHHNGRVIAADANASGLLYDADLRGDISIVLGAEGQGLSDAVRARVSERVAIPMAPGIESLNVAAAGAILCFERVRQCRGAGASDSATR